MVISIGRKTLSFVLFLPSFLPRCLTTPKYLRQKYWHSVVNTLKNTKVPGGGGGGGEFTLDFKCRGCSNRAKTQNGKKFLGLPKKPKNIPGPKINPPPPKKKPMLKLIISRKHENNDTT